MSDPEQSSNPRWSWESIRAGGVAVAAAALLIYTPAKNVVRYWPRERHAEDYFDDSTLTKDNKTYFSPDSQSADRIEVTCEPNGKRPKIHIKAVTRGALDRTYTEDGTIEGSIDSRPACKRNGDIGDLSAVDHAVSDSGYTNPADDEGSGFGRGILGFIVKPYKFNGE